MRNKHQSPEETALQSAAAEQQSTHVEFIAQSIPAWLVNASPERRAMVKNAPITLPDWYLMASQAQRQALNASLMTSMASQNLLDKTMARMQDINAFAQPLLVKALKDQFAVELDVGKTFLQLKKPLEVGVFATEIDTFEVLKLPLLQAALHNFEEGECAAGHYHASSGFVVETATPGQFDKVSTSLTVLKFLKLCRELDIGAKYQVYLKDFLQPANPVAVAFLRQRFVTCQKDAMRAAAETALLKKDIEPKHYSMIQSVIDGELNPRVDGKPVWFRDLGLMKKKMTGCVLFLIGEKYKYADEMLLYVPHDPEHPLKRYKGRALDAELKRQFMARDASQPTDGKPTAYQQFFSQFVAYADRPYYFSQFTRKAADALADPLGALRSPWFKGVEVLIPLTVFVTPKELPPEPTPRQEPETDPYIRTSSFSENGLWGPNVDPWDHLYRQSIDKIIADARHYAVPTAEVDATVRARKIAVLLEIGMLALNGVSMFVPVLGEVMIGIMAAQIMSETFEGAIEWSEGDHRAARAHLTDVAENLAMIAALHGAGKGFGKLAAVKPEPVIEQLQPVTLTTGEQRLWKPDLGPYKVPIRLPTDSKPNELGLHRYNGQDILPLDNDRFVVRQNPDDGQYRIQHASRADAYAPRLQHNGAGAWTHEAEEPLSWDGPILMRRLGYRAQAFTDAQLEQVRITSGVAPDQLRRLHVEQQPPAAQLSDSLTRFRIDRDIETFREHIGSDDPAIYAKADLRTQFRLIRRQALLPSSPPIKVLDSKARLIWEDPVTATTASSRLTFVVSDRQAAKGSVLTDLLDMFKARNVDIESVPGAADLPLEQRAVALRKEIARAAQSKKRSLFESLYQEQDVSVDPRVERIKGFFPQLPGIVAQQILEGATREEWVTLGESGPLPHGIYEQAERARQELRVAHAYEGLYLENSSSVDSERLALRSLEALPGWPGNVRFELREYGPQGKLLDTIGAPQDPTRAVLVVDEDTRFAQSSSANLYATVLQALTEQERQVMGFTLEDAERLKQTVQQQPLPRDRFSAVLQQYRLLKPVFEPGMKLLGGVGAAQVANFFRTPRMRVLKLFPDFSEAEVDSFLHSLAEDVRGGLTRYEAEYMTLKNELETWAHAGMTADIRSRVTGRVAGWRQRQIANDLKRCWRRQSGSTLTIGSTIELPVLSGRFSQVEALTMTGAGVRNLDAFLKCFPGLKKLRLEGMSRLSELPEVLAEMRDLTHLSFRRSGVRFSAHNEAVLGRLSALEELDLTRNPLGVAPDFGPMTHLKKINLSGTGIDEWPTGTTQLPDLQVLDLRENELTEVPSAMLVTAGDQVEANARVLRVTLLEDNPLSRQGWQQLKDYRDHLQALRPQLLEGSLPGAFKVQDSMTGRIRRLYPGYDEFDVVEFLQTHGVASEAELTRLEGEYETLNRQLSAWSFSGGGARQRYVRAGQRQDFAHLTDRYEAAERIRRCWRRQAPQRNAADGSPIGFELDLSRQTLDSVPDLEADFSHVGSLKLSGMGLSVSPEGFLWRFRGVRWLDLSNNQLTAIPPALGEMNGLTRLFLQRNRIRLTPETAELLAGRTTLRALSLSSNPLGMLPDFSRITDMRSLSLNNVGVDTWPVGLGAQPLLDSIDLRNNRITTFPESVINPSAEQLANTARLNNFSHIGGNPLTEAAQQQLRDYWARLERERPDLWGLRRPGVFEYLPPGAAANPVSVGGQGPGELGRWSKDLPADRLTARAAQWQSLSEHDGSQGFFRVLSDLEDAGAGHEDLQQRVWEVIDTITETSPESAALRAEMFEWAGRPACCDRAALSFSNLEIMAMVYRARTLALDGEQSAALLKLSRGLFRLDEVEKIALADIGKRTAAINANADLSAVQKAELIHRLEEVEIKLAYRFGLKDRLELPGQPKKVRFISMGGVTPAMLDEACANVVKLDDSAEEFQALVSRDFWKDAVTNKYRAQFETQREPYQDRLASLRDKQQAGELTEAQYKTQSEELDAQLQIEESALIEKLTRDELGQHPL
ncbi:NEL-type E3 ubiquitin ligase domain-containing protein [Pseudomonas sp. NPDC086278]|uniref:NEL-type E3 ubiquitin ligase domain-containing protein n=1 Tax=Pseudomonas sp. NPDC086278 TaxID=3390646 RepID=UPI003CFBEEF1